MALLDFEVAVDVGTLMHLSKLPQHAMGSEATS